MLLIIRTTWSLANVQEGFEEGTSGTSENILTYSSIGIACLQDCGSEGAHTERQLLRFPRDRMIVRRVRALVVRLILPAETELYKKSDSSRLDSRGGHPVGRSHQSQVDQKAHVF